MKLYYVEVEEDWDNLDIYDYVIFDLPTIRLKYRIYEANVYWLHIDGYLNNQIFKELGINEYDFVDSIVNYKTTGGFPNVRSLDDLKKVIKALDDECIKKFGIPDSKYDCKKEKYLHPSELKACSSYLSSNVDIIKQSTSCYYNGISHIINPYKAFAVDLDYFISDIDLKQDSQELNLFPTKKHYQLNFNY